MTGQAGGDATREQRLQEVLVAYLEAAERGREPQPEELFARHPDLAVELREFLANRAQLDGLAAPLRAVAEAAKAEADARRTLAEGTTTANASHGTLVRYFGDYELLEEIARGGMGVVFKARQVSLNRPVAIKMILKGELASEADIQRFRHEAEAAANLDHPNIVPIYEVGEHEGQHYFSMKLVEGGSVADKVPELLADSKAAARLLATVARAVHHAHQRGILHRDLKPANVLLDGSGEPLVTDFGLARRVEGEGGHTRSGAIVGTPAYMPPEQAHGEKVLTTAVDVYALGAILYEVLTGRPPFRGPTALDIILQVLGREPERPRALEPQLSRDLETICLKCLEKDPAKRYGSAAALAEDLERWLRGEPIYARPSTARERAWRWARRNPAVAALSVTLLGAVAAGTPVVLALWLRAEASARDARAQEGIARTERDLGRERLWQSLYEQARAEQATGSRWRALELLAEAARDRVTPELLREAIRAVTGFGTRKVCALGPRSLHIGGEGPFVAFSNDGGMVATADSWQEGSGPAGRHVEGVRVYEIPSGRLLGQAACNYYEGGFAFSPAAPLLALAGNDGSVRFWEPATGKETAGFPGKPPLRFSPDGALLAAGGEKGAVLWDMGKGKPAPLEAAGAQAFLANEELLVRDGKRFALWNTRTGRRTFASPDGWTPIRSAHLAAGDGPLVALRRGDGKAGLQAGDVGVWDVRSGHKLAEIPGVGAVSYAAAVPLSAAGRLLAFQDPDDPMVIRLFDLAAGKPLRRLVTPAEFTNALGFGRFNPAGTVLAVQEWSSNPNRSRGVRLWDVRTGSPLVHLPGENPVWSADGRYLAMFGPGRFTTPFGETFGDRSAVNVYEVALGLPTYRTPSAVHALTFSTDGSRLAAQDTTWEVFERQGPHLRPGPMVPAGGLTKRAAGGRMWAMSDQLINTADPVVVRQLFPEGREVKLNDGGRVEKGRAADFVVSPDGRFLGLKWYRYLATENPATKHIVSRFGVWNLLTGRRLAFGDQAWDLIRFSADGKTAVVRWSSGRLELWDVDAAKKIREVKVERESGPGGLSVPLVSLAIFSADGRWLYVATDQGRLQRVEVATGATQPTWTAPEEKQPTAALHPDGTTLATGGAGRTIYLWDGAAGRELVRWEAHEAAVTALAFSSDGRMLASGADDGTVRLWDLPALRRELAALGLDW